MTKGSFRIGVLMDEDMGTIIGKKTDGRKLSKKELWKVKQELASLQTRLGQLYMEKGNYASADSALLAAEAMNLYMDKTEIVVLSACETGLGQVTIRRRRILTTTFLSDCRST